VIVFVDDGIIQRKSFSKQSERLFHGTTEDFTKYEEKNPNISAIVSDLKQRLLVDSKKTLIVYLTDGSQAVEFSAILGKCDELKSEDIVFFMDGQMPGKPGVEAVAEIRKLNEIVQPVIIANSSAPELNQKMEDAGADYQNYKPEVGSSIQSGRRSSIEVIEENLKFAIEKRVSVDSY
jgi:CheY-like chemotaxis protein